MNRPLRLDYPVGVYGEISYQDRLERYCSYLENKLSTLTVNTIQCDHLFLRHDSQWQKCTRCGTILPINAW